MKLVRLSSGEEIVGNVEHLDDSINIKNGYSLIPTGEGKIGFMKFMAYTKAHDGVEINNRFIVFIVDPVDALVAQVREMDSGIVVPESSGIII